MKHKRNRLVSSNYGNDVSGMLPDNNSGYQANYSTLSTPQKQGDVLKITWKPTQEMFSNWRGYLWGFLLVVIITSLGLFASAVFSLENINVFYLLIVVVTAVYWGLGPSILVSISIVIALDYFFIPPILGFIPFRLSDVFTISVLLIVSVLISYLAARFRQKSEEARRHEQEVRMLYDISRNLANFTELEPSIRTILQISKSVLNFDIVIFLPDPQNKNSLVPVGLDTAFTVDSQVLWAVNWSFQKRIPVGQGTETYSDMNDRCLPLITPRGAVGIMVVKNSVNKNPSLPHGGWGLLQAFAELIAVSIENIRLAEEANKTEVLKAKDKLQTAILNSISHDLRTPLVSVIGVLSSLQDGVVELDDTARRNLIQVAYEDAKKLNIFIANLLDISRIEAGAIKLLRQSTEVAELISVALERLENRVTQRHLEINLPAELPFIDVDSSLFVQVFVNIIDNALKYSPDDSPIEICARQVAQKLEIEIADHGIGIPQSDLPHVFDKFYRVQRKNNIHGTGLGLSICKGIVESHGGSITAQNRPDGGTIIKLLLPISSNDIDIKDQKA
jgi:two-component system sensor histidine kinase KdpD